jgi:hypothetical protein
MFWLDRDVTRGPVDGPRSGHRMEAAGTLAVVAQPGQRETGGFSVRPGQLQVALQASERHLDAPPLLLQTSHRRCCGRGALLHLQSKVTERAFQSGLIYSHVEFIS